MNLGELLGAYNFANEKELTKEAKKILRIVNKVLDNTLIDLKDKESVDDIVGSAE